MRSRNLGKRSKELMVHRQKSIASTENSPKILIILSICLDCELWSEDEFSSLFSKANKVFCPSKNVNKSTHMSGARKIKVQFVNMFTLCLSVICWGRARGPNRGGHGHHRKIFGHLSDTLTTTWPANFRWSFFYMKNDQRTFTQFVFVWSLKHFLKIVLAKWNIG